MKAKKGQILVLVLIVMAMGLMVMAPFLSYMNSSLNSYTKRLLDTAAYYSVDAMMGQVFGDIYAGKDISILNEEDPDRYNNESWINGFEISTQIEASMANPPEAPSSQTAEWFYVDPGCGLGLNSLAYDTTFPYELALTENNTVTVNLYFKDAKYKSTCHYWCIGRIWITYENGSTVQHANSSSVDTGYVMNGVDTAFQQQLSWLVPEGGSNNYIINFRQHSKRTEGSSCTSNVSRSFSDMADSGVEPFFSGIGDTEYTWVRFGNSEGEQYMYQDYTVTVTASIRGEDVLTLTTCMRQTPGPQVWHEQQSLAVVSWIVTYH